MGGEAILVYTSVLNLKCPVTAYLLPIADTEKQSVWVASTPLFVWFVVYGILGSVLIRTYRNRDLSMKKE